MGTVRVRRNGTVFIDYIDASGRRIRHRIGIGPEARRLARRVLAQRESEAVLGIQRIPVAHSPRFADFATHWLDRMRPPRVRPKTWESYAITVERLVEAFGAYRLGALTRETIAAYLVSTPRARPHHAQQQKPLAPLSVTTINYTLAILRTILDDAVEEGVLAANPARRVKPLPKPLRAEARVPCLTPLQFEALLTVAEEPFKTLYRLCVDAGLRRGEAAGLKWDDLDLGNRRLTIRRSRMRATHEGRSVVRDGPPKTATSATTIEDLAPQTIQALLGLSASDSVPYVFLNATRTGALDPDAINVVFARHLKAAGIPPLPFHALRHTCATFMIAAGLNIKLVQHRMRHANVQVTLQTYSHLLPGAFEGVGARLEAWLQQERSRHTQGTTAAEPVGGKVAATAGTRVPTAFAPIGRDGRVGSSS